MHILEIGAEQDDEGVARAQEAAFRTVPKDYTTFLIWRVTESGTELLPRSHYGTFYDADAYLVYSCSLPGQPAEPDVIRREIKENGSGEYAERHVHAWAGAARAGGGGADGAGAAGGALVLRRAAQLLAHLGVPVVLHRENSTKESPRMLSYFRDGIRILRSGNLNGGPRLYRVQGHRPVVLQLEPVTWAQLASDGVFVLDSSNLIVLWLGRAANLIEKIFGAKIAYRMARGVEKGMMARRIAIAHDGYEQTLPVADRELLNNILELRSRTIRPSPATLDPPRAARLFKVTQPPRLSSVSVSSQRAAARLEEIKRAPLYREDLKDDSVYIVDAGSRGVWAWVGSQVAPAGARGALSAARGLARAKRLAGPVASMSAGREPLEFAALFHGWSWADARRDVRVRAARSATTKLDAVSLASNSWLAAEAQLPDDGSGSLRMWRMRREGEGPMQELERPQRAVFFDRDCYIALYTYHSPTGDQTILYYWMGGSSSNDLRDLGAKEAKDLYIKLGRLPIQAWVYQGKEPAHFLQIFKGRMITYIGSATDYDPSGRRVVSPPRALIRVSGQYAREARGVEVSAEGEGRGEGGRGSCYVLREGARVWVWCAATATGDEREVAKNMAAADHTLLMQGKEKADFWNALGERRHSLSVSPLRGVERPLPPRLFYVSLGTAGQYSFEEITSLSQYELAPEMAGVLDAHCALFVWLGAHAAHRARDEPRALARAYLAHDPAARDPETPIIVIHQGREPPHFTGFFPHWKISMWKGHKTFGAIVSALEGKAIVRGGNSALQSGNSENRFDQHEKYPLSVLRGPREHLPHDVDALAKELYLTHDDFVSTFNMTYNDFRSLTSWKQRELKKSVGLF